MRATACSPRPGLSPLLATDGANTLFREEMDRDLLGRITQKRETFGTTTTVTDYGYDETGLT